MIEALLSEIKERKLFVSNCYEGTDRLWRCFLRDKRNGLHTGSGVGKTMGDAIRSAMPAKSEFEDLLG